MREDTVGYLDLGHLSHSIKFTLRCALIIWARCNVIPGYTAQRSSSSHLIKKMRREEKKRRKRLYSISRVLGGYRGKKLKGKKEKYKERSVVYKRKSEKSKRTIYGAIADDLHPVFFSILYQSKVQQSVSPILLLFLFQNILTEGGWMASIDEKRTTSNCRGNCTLLLFMCFPQLLLLNFSLSLYFETKIKTRRGNVWRRNDTQSPPASFLACFRGKKTKKKP